MTFARFPSLNFSIRCCLVNAMPFHSLITLPNVGEGVPFSIRRCVDGGTVFVRCFFFAGNKTPAGEQTRRHNLRAATRRIDSRHPKAPVLSSPISAFFLNASASLPRRAVRRGSRNCNVSAPPCGLRRRLFVERCAKTSHRNCTEKLFPPPDCYSSLFEDAFTFAAFQFYIVRFTR